MAHLDWVNQSSRVIQAKANAVAYNAAGLSFNLLNNPQYTTDNNGNVNSINGSYFSFECIANTNKTNPLRYIQIVGDKKTNGYPVDFQISNTRVRTELEEEVNYMFTNNSKMDCVIDFKNKSLPDRFDVIITRWSKPNVTLDVNSISYIGLNVSFDLIENQMLSTFETERGLCYDGSSELSYGLKVNEQTLELNKDKGNSLSYVNKKNIIDVSNILDYHYVFLDKYNVFSIVNNKYNVNIEYMYGQGNYANFNRYTFKPTHIYYITSKNAVIIKDANANIVNRKQIVLSVHLSNNPDTLQDKQPIQNGQFLSRTNTQAYELMSFIYKCTNEYEFKAYTGFKYLVDISEVQSGQRNYEMEIYSKDFAFLDLTAIYGEGNEPTKEWCDTNIVCSSKDGKITIQGNEYWYTKDFSIVPVAHSKMLIRLENKPYIQFSTKLDIEKEYTPLACYYVDNFEYKESSSKFTLTLKDNLKLLTDNNVGLIELGDLSADGTTPTVNKLFNQYINKSLNTYLGLNIDQDISRDISRDISLPMPKYEKNVPYSNLYNNLCYCLMSYIISDEEDINRIYYVNSDSPLTYYQINTNRCYSLDINNNISNAITSVNITTKTFNDGNQELITKAFDNPQVTIFRGYISPNTPEDTNYSQNYSLFKQVLIPALKDSGNNIVNEINGSVTVSKDKFYSYDNVVLQVYVARAKYTFKVYALFNIEVTGVPSADGSTKNYIHNGTETVTTVNDLNDNDYSFAGWCNVNYYTEDSGDNVKINFTITLDESRVNNDTFANSTISSFDTVIDPIIGKTLVDENFIGAYNVYVFGVNNTSTDNTVLYTNGYSGNNIEIKNNYFMQNGSKYYTGNWNTSPQTDYYVANKIIEEFKNGKSIVELEWVGSPYIKLYNTIRLDNNKDYRVHYIKNIYDGGFRQKLKLVEKE